MQFSKPIIFLSHVHAESQTATLLRKEIESEFSGFVEVFVSSDEDANPTGTQFLNRIENRLAECSIALYLISKESVSKPWINFELGAVWVRSYLAEKKGAKEIPVIPMCYMGMTKSQLPLPLNSLTAVDINTEHGLRDTFKAIQRASGGSGNLRTDFVNLADEIRKIEETTMKGSKVVSILNLLIDPKDRPEVYEKILLGQSNNNPRLIITLKGYKKEDFIKLTSLINGLPVEVKNISGGISYHPTEGSMNIVEGEIIIQSSLIYSWLSEIKKSWNL